MSRVEYTNGVTRREQASVQTADLLVVQSRGGLRTNAQRTPAA